MFNLSCEQRKKFRYRRFNVNAGRFPPETVQKTIDYVTKKAKTSEPKPTPIAPAPPAPESVVSSLEPPISYEQLEVSVPIPSANYFHVPRQDNNDRSQLPRATINYGSPEQQDKAIQMYREDEEARRMLHQDKVDIKRIINCVQAFPDNKDDPKAMVLFNTKVVLLRLLDQKWRNAHDLKQDDFELYLYAKQIDDIDNEILIIADSHNFKLSPQQAAALAHYMNRPQL